MGGVPEGSLNLGVNGSSVTSLPAYTAKGDWIFFAVSYNSLSPADNVIFYVGNKTTPVSVVGTYPLTKQPAASFNAICIGNRNSRDRPFSG